MSALRPEDLVSLARDACARAGEADVEVHLVDTERSVARVSINEVREHGVLREPEARVRVARGARVGEASTAELTVDAIVAAIGAAAEIAKLSPARDPFPGFAGPDDAGPEARLHRASEEGSSAEARVDAIAKVLPRIRGAGLVAAATLQHVARSHAVVTTRGLARAERTSLAAARVWALETAGRGGAAGFDSAVGRTFASFDLERLAERAIRDARDAMAHPRRLDAGSYDVVLEPEAVATLLEWLGWIGFGGNEVEDGSSFLANRLGERITGERVTIVEDPLADDPGIAAATFDREGTARRRVVLVEKGVARGVLHDRASAARVGAQSTGSAVEGIFRSVGASALRLDAEGEADDVEALLSTVERGLHVRRFHYVNGFLEPRRAVMTGLTRDGTFLVENGRRVASVGNLRFTDSVLEAFARIASATRTPRVVSATYSDDQSVRAPALFIRGLRFSSGTPPAPEAA